MLNSIQVKDLKVGVAILADSKEFTGGKGYNCWFSINFEGENNDQFSAKTRT